MGSDDEESMFEGVQLEEQAAVAPAPLSPPPRVPLPASTPPASAPPPAYSEAMGTPAAPRPGQYVYAPPPSPFTPDPPALF